MKFRTVDWLEIAQKYGIKMYPAGQNGLTAGYKQKKQNLFFKSGGVRIKLF